MVIPPRSLTKPIQFPIRMITVSSVGGDPSGSDVSPIETPKLLAGGGPVLPINVALAERQRIDGATFDSLRTQAYAWMPYLEFCAHRRYGLLDVTDTDFKTFMQALVGQRFRNTRGEAVHLSGNRSRRTADRILVHLYSIAAAIEERYGVEFLWRRYKNVPRLDSGLSRINLGRLPGVRRAHRFPSSVNKIRGLPDDLFEKLLGANWKRWAHEITRGDQAFAPDPEAQRGALMYRNLALLIILRFTGGRRSEATELRLSDIDTERNQIYLVTKGRRKDQNSRLPVLLLPLVRRVLWTYVTSYRPLVPPGHGSQHDYVFVSHSVHKYAQKLNPQSVYSLLTTLRPTLDKPWNKELRPHHLRHSYAYMLQEFAGPAAIQAGMRHASLRSSEPYAAGPEYFADKLLEPTNTLLQRLLDKSMRGMEDL